MNGRNSGEWGSKMITDELVPVGTLDDFLEHIIDKYFNFDHMEFYPQEVWEVDDLVKMETVANSELQRRAEDAHPYHW